MADIIIRPNSKTRVDNIEIKCYGREMIMIEHWLLSAPKAIGPEDPDEFWSKTDEERLELILDYLDTVIDWEESGPDVLMELGGDIDSAREKIDG